MTKQNFTKKKGLSIVNSVAMHKAQLPRSFLLLNTFALMLNYRLHGFLLKWLDSSPQNVQNSGRWPQF